MKDYIKMSSPENKRKNNKNYIYGNKNGVIDYHHIEEYEVNGEKLKDYHINKDNEIKLLKEQNKELIEVIKQLNKKLNNLESKVKEYGII